MVKEVLEKKSLGQALRKRKSQLVQVAMDPLDTVFPQNFRD